MSGGPAIQTAIPGVRDPVGFGERFVEDEVGADGGEALGEAQRASSVSATEKDRAGRGCR